MNFFKRRDESIFETNDFYFGEPRYMTTQKFHLMEWISVWQCRSEAEQCTIMTCLEDFSGWQVPADRHYITNTLGCFLAFGLGG